jgi:hypothetical protein
MSEDPSERGVRRTPREAQTPIRHMQGIVADAAQELRLGLRIIQAFKQQGLVDEPWHRVEMKVRNALEYLTGSRE